MKDILYPEEKLYAHIIYLLARLKREIRQMKKMERRKNKWRASFLVISAAYSRNVALWNMGGYCAYVRLYCE